MLKKKLWYRLEDFLFENYSNRKNRDLRIILTQNTDSRRKCYFRNFCNHEETTRPSLLGKRSRSRELALNITEEFYVQRITLNPLHEDKAAAFLIENINRSLKPDDFFDEHDS